MTNLFETFRLIDGRAIGKVQWWELEGLIKKAERRAEIIRELQGPRRIARKRQEELWAELEELCRQHPSVRKRRPRPRPGIGGTA